MLLGRHQLQLGPVGRSVGERVAVVLVTQRLACPLLRVGVEDGGDDDALDTGVDAHAELLLGASGLELVAPLLPAEDVVELVA